MATLRGTDGWLYRQEFTRCNKPGCKRCERGPGHGPYWYKFRREEGRLVKKYVGKTLPRYVVDESAVQKALQKKTAVQLCPTCGKPLGDDLAELVGFEGLIYHKACSEEGGAHPAQSTVPEPQRRIVTENEAGKRSASGGLVS